MRRLMLMFLLSLGLISISPPTARSDGKEEEDITAIAEDEYDLKLTLKVPQVFDNSKSIGYRKYQTQNIKGKMYIVWLNNGSYRLLFENLENQQFKVGGQKVTYNGTEDRNVVYTRYNYIGSNKKNTFTTPTLCFFLELEPNYAIGGNTEDNSFFVTVAGAGSSAHSKKHNCRISKKFSGYVAGTQGCGCSAYGHLSPTRTAGVCGPTDKVDDVVATYGTWKATWKQRNYCK